MYVGMYVWFGLMYDKPQKVAKRSPADNEGWVGRITICFFLGSLPDSFETWNIQTKVVWKKALSI